VNDDFASNIHQLRPHHLSDPFSDFAPEHLKRLLAVRDDEMGWSEFQQLLGPCLPAGTYDESVYFLPKAFQYLVAFEREAFDLVTAVIGFCSKYADELTADHYMHHVKGKLRDCLKWWTRDFRVHNDFVENVPLICQSLEDLVRFNRHRDIALDFFRSLTDNLAQPVAACWFLALVRARSDLKPPPTIPEFAEPMNDKSLLVQAGATILKHGILIEKSPTYWNDTFNLVGL